MQKHLITASIPDRLRDSFDGDEMVLRIRNESADSVDFLLHGAIGEERVLQSWALRGFLADHRGKAVNVYINSPGGFVGDGVGMHNALAQHDGPTTAHIEGECYSAATIVAAGCDHVKMAETASYMIHRSWGLGIGNRHAMEELGEMMDMLDQQIALALSAHSNLSAAKILDLMDGKGKRDGTFMDADTALEYGFVDEVVRAKKKAKEKNATPHPEMIKAAREDFEAGRFVTSDELLDTIAVRMRMLELD